MKQKTSFKLSMGYWDWLKLLTDEELGKLFRAIFIYEREKISPKNLTPTAELAFTVIKNDLDEGQKRYDMLCNINKQKACIRWQKEQDASINT